MDRYSRNLQTLSAAENQKLRISKVCVAGCGGLGGNILEMLGRLGVGELTAIDGDVFEESNLNRQILSDTSNLGSSKALAAARRMALVNPDVVFHAVPEFLTQDNACRLLSGHHVIVDALDSISSRRLLAEQASLLGIPLVHGAVAGWYGQVTTIFPGEDTLDRIYRTDRDRGTEQQTGNPSFGPALISALEVCEAVKILTDRGRLLRKKLLTVNLLDHEYEVVELG